jgi:hypothetical protein
MTGVYLYILKIKGYLKMSSYQSPNSPNVQIGSLLGFMKSASDIQSHPKKIRYSESVTVRPGQVFRITFPKVADDMLDCASPRLRFTFELTGGQPVGGATVECIDNRTVQSLFNRIRVISGSNVIADLNDAAALFSFMNHAETKTNDSVFERYQVGNRGRIERASLPRTKEYVCNIMPKGSILNCDACLPLSRMNDLHVEFTMQAAEKCLYSDSPESKLSYNLSNVEMLATYYRSASLSQYFNASPVSFHVHDFSHRYSTVLSQNSLVRFQSSHSSLDGIVTFLQLASVKNGGLSQLDKVDLCVNPIKDTDLYINNQLYYEEPVNSNEQRWLEATSMYECLKTSEWFDFRYNTTRHFIFNRLISTAAKHQGSLISGTRTSQLNTDITLRLNLTAPPEEPVIATSFLISSVLIYLDKTSGARGDLKIQY